MKSDTTPEQGRGIEARLRVLSEAMRAFAEATADPQRLLETVVERVATVVGDSCLALLLSDDGRALTLEAAFDRDPDVSSASCAKSSRRRSCSQSTR